MKNKAEILDLLDSMKIEYELINHIEINTIEELENICMENTELVAKNLFLRDDKKRKYYLICIKKDKIINLKDLKDKLNSRPLSFASETDLFNILKLKKGAVTPLGILNDEESIVEVIVDEAFKEYEKIGIHPNDNTSTIFINIKDLETIVTENGNLFEYLNI